MRRLRRTMMLMIEKVPNITRPQNRVNSCFFFFNFCLWSTIGRMTLNKTLIPASSKLSRLINPRDAQNRVCVVSHKLSTVTFLCCWLLMIMMTILMVIMTTLMMLMLIMTMILCKLPISEAVVDVNGNMAGSLGFLLVTNSSWGPSTNCGGIAPIIFIGA